jgi:probable F420-dependent oxidoreductase
MGRVRLSVFLPTYAAEDPGRWDHVFDIARAADLAGVDRVVVSDHVVFGEDLGAYAQPERGGVEGGRQPTGPDGHWLEPLTVLTGVAVQTDRVRLGTYILLAALRRPAVLAKQVATLDVLSGGRLDLGVGIGWQREEYEASGLDYAARGRLLDHTLEVCRTLWSDECASIDTPELAFDGIHAMPKPVQPGGLPVWVSGRANARVAERLARFGRGWIPWAEDAAAPKTAVPKMRSAVERAGGDPKFDVLVPFRVARGDGGGADLAAVRAGLEELATVGVTDVLVHVRALQSFAEAEAAYGELVETFGAATG